MSKKKTNKKSKQINKQVDKIIAKKVLYVVLTVFLGKLFGLLAFELITAGFVNMLEKNALQVEYVQIFGMIYSPLPAYLFWSFILVGAVGGFFLGLTWWQIVYVEHRHWRNKTRKF